MKKLLMQQYQDIVDQAVAGEVRDLAIPPEGWVRTLRKALGMSGAQLARRLGVSRAQVAQSERNEASGAVTLNTLHNMAQAMGGRLVYAIVPMEETARMVSARAEAKAMQLVAGANTHMALEKQSINEVSQAYEIERLKQELLGKMPKDLWDDM